MFVMSDGLFWRRRRWALYMSSCVVHGRRDVMDCWYELMTQYQDLDRGLASAKHAHMCSEECGCDWDPRPGYRDLPTSMRLSLE